MSAFTGIATIAQAQQQAPKILFDSIDRHPFVTAKDAEIDAARRMISMESSWMDPMLMLGVENLPANSLRFDQDPMSGRMIGISQRVPFPGKLAKSREAGEANVVAQSIAKDENRNLLRKQIASAYFDLYPLTKGLETKVLHLRWFDQMIASAESRLQLGLGRQQEVLEYEIAKAELAQEIQMDSAMLAMKLAELEYASGQTPHLLKLDSLGVPEFHYSLADLVSIARDTNPSLRAMTSRASKFSLDQERIALDKYPDFDISLQYMNRSSLAADAEMNPMKYTMEPAAMHMPDMVSLGVSFPIPLNLGNSRTDREEELSAMAQMEVRTREAMLREMESMLKAKLAMLGSLRARHLILIHQIIPLAKELSATADANYTAGEMDLPTLLNNRLSYLHRIHDVYQIEADYNKTIVEIEYLVGTRLK